MDDAIGDGIVTGDQGSLTARLHQWLSDARTEGSAAARSRERWLHRAAQEGATVVGILLDLAERGAPVAISVAGGRRHHGTVQALGRDFVALRAPSGSEVLLVVSAMVVVRPAPQVDVALGERVLTTDLRLADVLSELAGERARLLVVSGDGSDAVAGEAQAVGRDVMVLQGDGPFRGVAYVPLAAITEVTLA